MTPRITPLFLNGFDRGRRFALMVEPPPDQEVRGSVLIVQGLADEANLARRVLLRQSLRLASAGWTTVNVDLFGCGDSDGDTTDARFSRWQADLLRAAAFSRLQAPGAFVILGVRLGCLLAAELASALDGLVSGLVFWQPPASGAAALEQWMRLERIGGVGRAATGGSATAPAPRDITLKMEVATRSIDGAHDEPDLRRGSDCMSLGGYLYHRELIDALGGLAMRPPLADARGTACPVLMVGVQRVPSARTPAAKALAELTEQWRQAGYPVESSSVQGEPFWSSLEPSEQPALIDVTATFIETLDA